MFCTVSYYSYQPNGWVDPGLLSRSPMAKGHPAVGRLGFGVGFAGSRSHRSLEVFFLFTLRVCKKGHDLIIIDHDMIILVISDP